MPGSGVTPADEEEKKQQGGIPWIMGATAFEARMAHHDGIQALWETKWKGACSSSVYPFHDGRLEDFEPVLARLMAHRIDDPCSAAYTEAFLPAAAALVARAEQRLATAASENDAVAAATATADASALFLRACCLYRIARFPYISRWSMTAAQTAQENGGTSKWRAWDAQKRTYLRAAQTWAAPVEEVLVPHVFGRPGEGSEIPVYVRLPPAAAADKKVPTVLLLTGLDGYRPDNTGRCDEFAARGWASVVAEIPGTADCPADPADPASAERLWDSLLAWMETAVPLDMRRLVVWGLSAGGYYAARMAHTHAARLAGAVAQGAGVHHFFSSAWLARIDGHEYPFALTPALAAKHGIDRAALMAGAALPRFSLLAAGLLDGPSARLLVVNGTQDGLMPLEDSLLLLSHGRPKEARFFSGALHMGYPGANTVVYPWIEGVMGEGSHTTE